MSANDDAIPEPATPERIMASLQALNCAVLALIASHPDPARLAAELEAFALRWEGNAGNSRNSDQVVYGAAAQVRRFAALARNRHTPKSP